MTLDEKLEMLPVVGTIFQRATVRGNPVAILKAPKDKALKVVVWVAKENSEGDENGLVLISTTESPESDWLGCPVPFDAPLPAFVVYPGQYVFAVSRGESEVSMMVQEA